MLPALGSGNYKLHSRSAYGTSVYTDGNKDDDSHSGSTCAMEQEADLKLWQASEDNDFRYTTLLSDGDAKTYQYLNSKEVYGPEIKNEEKRAHKPY
ncbi:hypothetical protein TNCV_3041041 [Trichonephila clavipes]|nr:hypothetical protein TNCV_3041041 [Trichonephila clavipes]